MTIDEPTATPELVFRRDALSEPGMSPERFAAEFRLLRGEVHIGRGEMLTARQRVIAIAYAAQGDPVVGGQAAMVMHGSRWFDSDFPILLIRGASASGRAARGSIPRRVDLPPEHIEVIDGIAVTSPIRTAFDVGRIQPRMRAIGHLDALAAATAYGLGELADYAETQKGVRYVRQLKGLIPRINSRSESPQESSSGLFFDDAGLPTMVVQYEVFNEYGILVARHDWAYPELKIGIEYDGEEYHSSPEQRASDAARDAESARLGWKVIRANKHRMRTHPMGVVNEIAEAIRTRGGYYS